MRTRLVVTVTCHCQRRGDTQEGDRGLPLTTQTISPGFRRGCELWTCQPADPMDLLACGGEIRVQVALRTEVAVWHQRLMAWPAVSR